MLRRPTLRDVRPAVQPQASRLRGAIAILAAVLVASIMTAIAVLILADNRLPFPRDLGEFFYVLFWLSILVLPLALPLVVLAGASILSILFWRVWHGAAAYATAGVLGGAVLAWLVFSAVFPAGTLLSWEPVTGFGGGAAAGLASALGFWVVYRPDRASIP